MSLRKYIGKVDGSVPEIKRGRTVRKLPKAKQPEPQSIEEFEFDRNALMATPRPDLEVEISRLQAQLLAEGRTVTGRFQQTPTGRSGPFYEGVVRGLDAEGIPMRYIFNGRIMEIQRNTPVRSATTATGAIRAHTVGSELVTLRLEYRTALEYTTAITRLGNDVEVLEVELARTDGTAQIRLIDLTGYFVRARFDYAPAPRSPIRAETEPLDVPDAMLPATFEDFCYRYNFDHQEPWRGRDPMSISFEARLSDLARQTSRVGRANIGNVQFSMIDIPEGVHPQAQLVAEAMDQAVRSTWRPAVMALLSAITEGDCAYSCAIVSDSYPKFIFVVIRHREATAHAYDTRNGHQWHTRQRYRTGAEALCEITAEILMSGRPNTRRLGPVPRA